jgi:hypothetical protein
MQTSSEATRDEPDTSLSRVMQAASLLVSSPEPTVVFASLVQLSAPLVCDAATATVSEPERSVHATSWPACDVNQRSRPESLVTAFDAPASGDYAGYHGIVSLRFRLLDESRPFIAQLLVERAMAIVERARLVESAQRCEATADQLERSFSSNREIAVAVGIVMANHKLGDEEAFELLGRVSQHTNRELRLVALEVARAGVLELPRGVAVTEPSTYTRRRLFSVPTPGLG